MENVFQDSVSGVRHSDTRPSDVVRTANQEP
jgi:hypothetical protein